jgi:post-segregation antitoxin (ccd killing protein)
MSPNKALSLRLPEDKVAELAAVARADEMQVSDAVREAIDNHIASRRADKDFQRRLKRLSTTSSQAATAAGISSRCSR